MEWRVTCTVLLLVVGIAKCEYYLNYTGDAVAKQLWEFKNNHPQPIGLFTTSSGEPVELRKTKTVNSDVLSIQNHIDLITHLVAERIPERIVHPRGVGAYGYFEVTNDVSKYTNADVFNGIGKKTPLVARLSLSLSNLGSSELGYELRGFALKFYTKVGNLDLLCLQIPIYTYRDGIEFPQFVRARRRNPRTNIMDQNANWDFITLKPFTLHAVLWLASDYGSPRGYRRMDAFPVHTYEVSNAHGVKHYVKFSFRTEQGLANLTVAENMAIGAEDPDYFSRDLYNSIAAKNYPSWRLEMDVLSEKDLKKLDYDPFDVTRVWKEGTYYTVTIGRVVLNQRVDNNFKDVEQSAYNPANLVPGIPGPPDFLFKTRRLAYADTQNYRLGRNHNKIEVNTPKYAKTYNRDSEPPLRDNMKDAPNYHPNSFSGPVPYVDATRPKERLFVVENTAIDLEPPANFYNNVVKTDAHKQRLANNVASSLLTVYPNTARRALKLLNLVDEDLGKRVAHRLRLLKAAAEKQSNEQRYQRNAQCFESNMNELFHNVEKSKLYP